ncbi:hypothetical protein Nwi_0825 [Nitrobacter winogradskyi Nb-255]|uniref:IrrE N-terminal-like domain-containing protein n=1 Tax=Nitrobacter winogradskyi (strain ATCC 25391 / DSM 10237 / CIP 104748 / NCIMB 11846 / Nb-255) TaxID=323098 RepID=Q3SUF1_NITWN|nr:hypothetical protein Nwi_0825 [Nitrobacter winogradskyi Nb-255]
MVLAIAYPSTAAGDPHRLSAQKIASIASDIRARLFGVQPRPVDVAALIAKTARLVVNGKPINLSWGLDRPIHDENGHEALGVCENDPELPDTVMISINASLLAHQPEVIRSTAAHEFAHAIFDMPAAMGGNIRRTFRTSVAPAIARPGAPIDWVEWRADEFMGAFLVPADKLARVLPKHASALDLPFHWRAAPDGRSVPFVDLDPSEGTLGLLVDDLAEAFGVTAAFMSVRLAKGGFIGRRFETGSTL